MCWPMAVRRPFGTVTAIQAPDRLRCDRCLHVPLGDRATLPLIGEAQHPQVMICAVERPLGRIGILEGYSHRDRHVVLDQQRAVRTTIRPCRITVLQPGSNDVGTAASHILSLVPRTPTVLGVLGTQSADLAWIIDDPGVVVRVEPPLHHLSVNLHGPFSSLAFSLLERSCCGFMGGYRSSDETLLYQGDQHRHREIPWPPRSWQSVPAPNADQSDLGRCSTAGPAGTRPGWP